MRSVLPGLLRRRTRPLALACVSSSVHQACEALVPLAIGLAIDHAVDGGPPLSILLAVGAVLALFTLLAAGGGTTFWQLTQAAAIEAHHLRVRLAARLLDDPRAGAGRRAGDLATVLVSDAKATADIMRAVVNVVSGAAGLLVTAAVLLRVDPWLGVGIAIGAPAITLAVNRISPWLEHRIAARQQTAGLAAALAAELVQALRPLRGFGGVPEAVRRYRLASRTSLDAALRGATASAAVEGAGLIATGLVLLGTAAAAGAMARSGRISAGELVTVVAMAAFAGDPVQRVAGGIKQAAISRASAARVTALLGPEPAATDPAGRVAGPLRLHLAGLDLTLHPGELLGVVTTSPDSIVLSESDSNPLSDPHGTTPAGPHSAPPAEPHGTTPAKPHGTTPAGPHSAPPTEPHGTPPAGSHSVSAVGLDRRRVLVEPHAVQLFGRTLAEALDTGRDADPAVTARALSAARAAEVGAALLDGGANLSGGQRQRVALARALAARPEVLVLRDPLTAVDAVTEDAVAAGLAELRRADGGVTVLISTSPPLLTRCDRVVFRDGDRPAVLSTHDRLTENPAYAKVVLR